MVSLFGAGLGALLVAARMELLPRQDYGVLNTLLSAGTILQLVLALGATTMLQTFIQRYPSTDPRHRTLIGLVAIVPLVSMFAFLCAYIPLKENIIHSYKNAEDRPLIRLYYYWLPVLTLLWSYCTIVESYLASQYKTAQSAFMREIVLRIGFVILTVLLYFEAISIPFYIIGTLLSFGLQLSGLLIAAFRTPGFRPQLRFEVFNKPDYREMARFSWYHLLAGSSWFIIGYFDMLLLGQRGVKGLEDAAIYGISIFFISIFTLPYRTMVASAFPRLNQAYIEKDKTGLSDLYNRTALNVLIISLAMGIVILLCLNDYVALFKREYSALVSVTAVLLLGRLIEIVSGPNAEVIGFSSYYKFIFRSSILVVFVLLALDYYLIPRYGALGAAWGATISWSLFNVAKYLFALRYMQLQPFGRNTLIVLLCGLVTLASLYFIPVMVHPILDAILRGGLGLLLYGALLLWLQPSPDLVTYLNSVKARKKLF